MTTAKLTEAYHKVNFHLISDDSEPTIARNILIAHIILSDGFDPLNPTDLQYLWDVWYSLQWNEATKKRFIKDVKQLLAGLWTNSQIIKIPDAKGVEQLKQICSFWLETASNAIFREKVVGPNSKIVEHLTHFLNMFTLLIFIFYMALTVFFLTD